MSTSARAAHTSDSTIIDVTGQEVPLRFQVSVSVTKPVRSTTPATSYIPPDYGYDMPKLGKQYRKKLGLTTQQVEWLDKFWPPHNVFIALKGCCVATIQLYLQAMPALEAELKRNGASLAQLVAQSQQESSQLRRAAPNPYGWSEYDDRCLREQTEATIYSMIFRRCENVVREVYGNKRKLAAEFSGLDETVALTLEQQVGAPLAAILSGLVATIAAPDEATDRELNLQNIARWKQQLDHLAVQLTATTTREFVEGVNRLGERNARNPAIEHIFFEASKFMAKYDREEALRFYLQYVYHDLRSVTVNNKALAKTIQKSLFPQPEHLQRFEALVSQLVSDKDLPQALSQVPTVYARQRRKIELDLGAIQAVQHQHAGTVELLNEYLQDEPELPEMPVPSASQTQTLAASEPEEEIQLAVATAAPAVSVFTSTSSALAAWGLTATQEALLARFAEQALTLPQAEVEAFARQHGALRNQLIDSINEQCYERLDDVLIEEDGDTYTIYESYYQQLATPC
ncbi:tellurite resistance TerB C-terminal domain-containing protein [Hymenobacter ruricola]|uniref:TerB-C domain-containing protein n=1 Tax=Hymenobacter ruricola TaxID=2791023 RepID=A0ABS0I382_9BACT|nr:tellurite resistance TerB C-terminal domain-containing protein [Hymenobacter ruricola]MBF9221374.1 hypothetical protein [Hymenobacter ruricola]